MKELVSVMRAADAVARWHVHQRRKGIAQEPYINHLLEVASLVSEATSGSDPTVVIAALLHDAVEDQEVPVEMIAREFGKQVADIVMEVTDDKTLPKDERKRKQIETAPKKSREAELIKLADKPAIFEPSRPVQPLIGRQSGDWNTSNGPRTSWLACEECRLGYPPWTGTELKGIGKRSKARSKRSGRT